MSQTPKHFVFLACPPSTIVRGNSAATLFAAVIGPEDLDTFLCHWINPVPSQQPIRPMATSFRDCPKLVMLLNRQEIGRLAQWCHRFFTHGGQRPMYGPKVITDFYAFNRNVQSMYYGICHVKHNPQQDLYWWAPEHLRLPFVAGVRWTESTCQFFRLLPHQAPIPHMACTGLPDLSLASNLDLSSTPGHMTLDSQQMGNANFPGGQSQVSHANRANPSRAPSSGEDVEERKE
ncbi:hypothetical protein LY76DRAFT_588676 [Colletotrichum caudatum]|nr:hypothetical protein LY76DRAFT_588676 [Colletotrichum caudatum]